MMLVGVFGCYLVVDARSGGFVGVLVVCDFGVVCYGVCLRVYVVL